MTGDSPAAGSTTDDTTGSTTTDPTNAPPDDAASDPTEPAYDGWYRYGRLVLYGEMLIAVLVTVFSLYLAFTGTAGFLT